MFNEDAAVGDTVVINEVYNMLYFKAKLGSWDWFRCGAVYGFRIKSLKNDHRREVEDGGTRG